MFVVAVFVAPLEALAKVISVVFRVNVVAVVAVGRVLVGIALAEVGAPIVLTVGLSGAEAFLIAIVHRLAQRVGAVLIDFVVGAAAVVTINRSGIEVGIIVVVVPFFAETPVLIAEMLEVLFLEAVLRHTSLLLQLHRLLLQAALLVLQVLAILSQALLLLLYQLLLALL